MCVTLHVLFAQDGGAGMFQKKAVLLEKHVAEAEREAGGNKDELELTLRRVSVCWRSCLSWRMDILKSISCYVSTFLSS
jgi:hypothetical protein